MQETVKDVPLIKIYAPCFYLHTRWECVPCYWCGVYQVLLIYINNKKMEALLIHSNMFWSWFYSEHTQHSSLYQWPVKMSRAMKHWCMKTMNRVTKRASVWKGWAGWCLNRASRVMGQVGVWNQTSRVMRLGGVWKQWAWWWDRVVYEKDEQCDETGWCMKRMSREMRWGGVWKWWARRWGRVVYGKDEQGNKIRWCMKTTSTIWDRMVYENDEQGDETGCCMKRMRQGAV